MKIIVIVFGGLGNQLFQILTALSLSDQYKIEVNFYSKKTSRNLFYWDSLFSSFLSKTIDDNEINNNQLHNLPCWNHLQLTYKLIPIYMINNHSSKTLILNSYFQHLYYLSNISYIHINKWLNINQHQEILQQQLNISCYLKNSVCIHIRLGDYKLSTIYTILSNNYYLMAIEYLITTLLIEENTKNELQFLLFIEHDEMNEIKELYDQLQTKYNHVYIISKLYPSLTDWQELILMSLCNYHIIANSTFSWWGAYLATQHTNLIIYPLQWFHSNSNISNKQYLSGMIPSLDQRWIGLNHV